VSKERCKLQALQERASLLMETIRNGLKTSVILRALRVSVFFFNHGGTECTEEHGEVSKKLRAVNDEPLRAASYMVHASSITQTRTLITIDGTEEHGEVR
jgi:hypothetical protein